MANPAPIIQKINAFDATIGTTINFNIIGGTEIVRSNKIYIYSVATNELIVTHTYIGTQSYHILPANTDASMIYATGKTSADFTNENQYYAQIQTFTNTASTVGASGISVASLFWCLLFPTVQFDTIVSPINTTSYNFTAKYSTEVTTAIDVTNKLQQYQFDLYDASDNIVQTSGAIIGSGTPTAIPKEYSVSYNFVGLNNGNTYYVVLTCISTEGMQVTSTSDQLTISINVPTFTKARVYNNSCNGSITVISNMTNIEGDTSVPDVSSLTGEIDLTGGGYLTWDTGFTFPTINSYGQWTLELWGNNFDVSSITDNNSFLINLNDSGKIFIYIRQGYDSDDILKTRADMYVYPFGIGFDVCSYLYSDYISNPSPTDNLDVWIRCIEGLYEITLKTLS